MEISFSTSLFCIIEQQYFFEKSFLYNTLLCYLLSAFHAYGFLTSFFRLCAATDLTQACMRAYMMNPNPFRYSYFVPLQRTPLFWNAIWNLYISSFV